MGDVVPLLVRLNGQTIHINAALNWSIFQLKQYLYVHNNVPVEEIKVVFAGSELSNSVLLKEKGTSQDVDVKNQNCQFAHGTVVHAITINATATKQANITHVTPTNFIAPTSEGIKTQTKSRRAKFYVYCKSPCQSVKPGKLRVRCKQCKDKAFEISSGPNSWQDVLSSNRVEGRCNANGCSCTAAEFFFKCSAESHTSDEALPLSLLRTNLKDIPCLACTDISDVVLVFPCQDAHVICVDCFAIYCQTRLNQRQFILMDRIGYTLSCPGLGESCSQSYIEEIHHFLIAGKIQYERYKNFATEEFVLQNGGLLCPGEGCGNGLMVENDEQRKVVCYRSRGGCGHVFCRLCRLQYHDGECETQQCGGAQSGGTTDSEKGTSQDVDVKNQSYGISLSNAAQARWQDEYNSRQMIGRTTKPCPGCKTPIEKSGGCNHMICSRCQFEWCWLCQIIWSRNCEADHWFRAG